MEKLNLPYEVWKSVKGYEGLYQVSNLGGVKRLVGKGCRQERILKPRCGCNFHYLQVHLSKDGINKNFLVHRLVAGAFIPNPDNLPQVNHKDENTANNRVENLEWVSAKDNCNYGTRNERQSLKMKCVYNTKNSKPVHQFTLDGEFVREWPSVSEVQRQTGWSQGNISACCRGDRYKSAHGYIWRYTKKAES